MVYNIHILQTRKTGRVVAAAAASVLCCMGAVFPATIGVTAASADEPVELVVNGGFEDDLNGWKSGTVWNSSASSIAVTADDVHGGSGALSVTDRTSSDAGAIQSLDGKVEKDRHIPEVCGSRPRKTVNSISLFVRVMVPDVTRLRPERRKRVSGHKFQVLER